MNRKIINFIKDEHEQFIAVLECLHTQHQRHKPPLIKREWVLSQKGRDAMIGTLLNCKYCDENK